MSTRCEDELLQPTDEFFRTGSRWCGYCLMIFPHQHVFEDDAPWGIAQI